jgi:hypothetical protein
MPRFDSLADNHFNLLIPNLINAVVGIQCIQKITFI